MEIEIDPGFDRIKHSGGYASFFNGKVVLSYRTQHDIMSEGDITIAMGGKTFEWRGFNWKRIPMPEIPPEVKTYLFLLGWKFNE